MIGMARAAATRAALAGVVALGLNGPPTSASAEVQPPRVSDALYDLAGDEALGGHTIARHIGKSDDELFERLKKEPQISAASTYTDVETARRVVAAALAQSRDRLQAWERRSGARPNLVLNYAQSGGRPIGRSLARGERVARSCRRALVVIRWHERRRAWYVLTSYPEASR